jgi:aspartyl-tRNA(Asn)/glutamyl-tRNA(Gln) amidotransferase subunit B
MRIGLAVGCEVAPRSLFHRKHYFYPDMPKNFQISQYDLPLCTGGYLDIEVDGGVRRIGMNRVHLEEDTGKTTHAGATGRISEAEYALVDYNRAGVPLVEVVSEPQIRSAEEARAYFTELRALLEALGVSDVRMEEGSMRCDANISVRRRGQRELGVKAEIKNLNSIRSLYNAVRFEEERQRQALREGQALVQETRHWDEGRVMTVPLRSKEYAFDYRYFPEPDLPPVEPDPEWIEKISASLPELPAARRARYVIDYGLRRETARVLAGSRAWTDLFEEAIELGADPVAVANWMTQDLAGLIREGHISLTDSPLTANHLADIIALVKEGTISTAAAKQVLAEAFTTGAPAEAIVEEKGLRQVSDTGALGSIVDEVIAENPQQAEQYRAGKDTLLQFFVGQVMKKTRGSANPQLAAELLRERLGP